MRAGRRQVPATDAADSPGTAPAPSRAEAFQDAEAAEDVARRRRAATATDSDYDAADSAYAVAQVRRGIEASVEAIFVHA